MLFQREAKIGGNGSHFIPQRYTVSQFPKNIKLAPLSIELGGLVRTTGAPETGPVIRFFMNGKITETR